MVLLKIFCTRNHPSYFKVDLAYQKTNIRKLTSSKTGYRQNENIVDLLNLEKLAKLQINNFDFNLGEVVSAIIEKNLSITINPTFTPKLEEGQILCVSVKFINSFLTTGYLKKNKVFQFYLSIFCVFFIKKLQFFCFSFNK